MANEIYHKSNWGSPKKDGWGDSYFNPSATNKLYTRSDNYENVEGTDKALASKPDTQSVLMTPTAYSVGSMNSILPPYEVLPTELVTNGDFATDSDWTKGTGWTIAGGIASLTAQGASSGLGSTVMTVTSGNTYKVVIDVISTSTGFRLYDALGVVSYYLSVGKNTFYRTVSSSSYQVTLLGLSGASGSIESVSVKEVRNADFTFDRNSTATRVNKEGLIETVAIDTPRLDYPLIDGVVQSEPSLLLEPTRTNLITYSEDFTQWSLSGATITSNSTTSPEGLINASTMTTSVSGDTAQNIPSVSNGNITFSCFAKKGSINGIRLRIDAATDANGFFDLTNGIIYSSDGGVAKIESFGNDWFRVSISANITSFVKLAIYTTDGTNAYDNGDIYIYGAQVEQGSYPTSYIPTSGSAVTRAAETANGAGDAATFNDSEGVLMVETKILVDDGRLGISNADNSDQVIIGNANGIFYRITENNSNPITQFIGVSEFENHKIALKYKSTETSIVVDGFELDTNNTTYSLSGLNELAFTAQGSSFYGNTKQVQYYDTALTDTELEALTSWDSFSDMATGQEYSIK